MEKLQYYSMPPNDNAPYPVKEEGAYCDKCNATIVMTERVKLARREL